MSSPNPTRSLDLRSAAVRMPDHVAFRALAAQTVVLDLSTGRYHALDPGAGRMLELLAETGSIAAAGRRLAAEVTHSAAEVETDLCELCAHLLERGFLEYKRQARP